MNPQTRATEQPQQKVRRIHFTNYIIFLSQSQSQSQSLLKLLVTVIHVLSWIWLENGSFKNSQRKIVSVFNKSRILTIYIWQSVVFSVFVNPRWFSIFVPFLISIRCFWFIYFSFSEVIETFVNTAFQIVHDFCFDFSRSHICLWIISRFCWWGPVARERAQCEQLFLRTTYQIIVAI